MKIQESAEMYLETIYVLSQQNPQVRSIDIANELEYSKPSVSVAMKNLRTHGYVLMDENGFITLTPAGESIALSVYGRHTLLADFLTALGVSRETAVADACKIEHCISAESFEALTAHYKEMTAK